MTITFSYTFKKEGFLILHNKFEVISSKIVGMMVILDFLSKGLGVIGAKGHAEPKGPEGPPAPFRS